MHTYTSIHKKQIEEHCTISSQTLNHPSLHFSLMALLLPTLLLLLSISVVSSQELQNERNITKSGTEAVCEGNCNPNYSSPPPPYQLLPIYGPPPPPSSGQGSQPQCPPSVPCCQYAPPQPYYYPPQPYLAPPQPFGYQPYYNYSGASHRLVFYDGYVLGLCFLVLGAIV